MPDGLISPNSTSIAPLPCCEQGNGVLSQTDPWKPRCGGACLCAYLLLTRQADVDDRCGVLDPWSCEERTGRDGQHDCLLVGGFHRWDELRLCEVEPLAVMAFGARLCEDDDDHVRGLGDLLRVGDVVPSRTGNHTQSLRHISGNQAVVRIALGLTALPRYRGLSLPRTAALRTCS